MFSTRLKKRTQPYRLCQLCAQHQCIDSLNVCQGCFADLPLSAHFFYQKDPSTYPLADETAYPHNLQSIRAACDYVYPITQLIFRYKYDGDFRMLPLLSDLLMTLPKPSPQTLLVPMPSSASRLKQRGFDHIQLLSKRLSAQWQLPLWQGVKRIGDAPTQKGLSREERLENISGQFILNTQPPCGHRLMIIDDVCTTGSTIGALSQCLAQTGLDVAAYVVAHKRGVG